MKTVGGGGRDIRRSSQRRDLQTQPKIQIICRYVSPRISVASFLLCNFKRQRINLHTNAVTLRDLDMSLNWCIGVRTSGCSGCSCTHNIQPVGADNVGILQSAPTILWDKNTRFIIEPQKTSYLSTNFRYLLGSILQFLTITTKAQYTYARSIRYWFYNNIVCGILESLHQSAISSVGSWTLHLAPTCSKRSYARELVDLTLGPRGVATFF